MARFFVYLFFNACFVIVYSSNILDLNSYLADKYKFLQEVYSEKNHRIIKRDSPNVLIEKLQENVNTGLQEYITTVFFPNYINIIANNGIYNLSDKSHHTNNLYKISEIKNVKFSKTITFNGVGYLIIHSGLSDESYIYQYVNGSFEWVQNVQTLDARDGHFFINNNNLYLIVASNKGTTSIYKWLGFHFDEIRTVFTTEAIKVGSFTTRAAEIIIILQDIPNKAFPSAVFSFNNDEIKKIQLIKSLHGNNLRTYSSQSEKYVVIFTKTKENFIYKWDGDHLVLSNTFQLDDIANNAYVYTTHNKSFLEIPFTNKLQIYNIIGSRIKLENEIHYKSNLTKVADVFVEKNITYIIGMATNNITVNAYSVDVKFNDSDSLVPNKDVLKQCLNSLNLIVNNVFNKVSEIKNELTTKFKLQTETLLKSESLVQESAVENQIQDLSNRYNEIEAMFNKYNLSNDNNLIINGKVTFKGKITSEGLTSDNIIIKNVNGRKWTPEQWLRYKKPQTISGPSKIKNVTADRVETSPKNPLLKDVLLTNQNQVLNGSVQIESLTVQKLYADSINGIHMNEIYFKNKPEPIKGLKSFKNLNVDDAVMTKINEKNPNDILSSVLSESPDLLDLDANVTVENLEVETINGINWEEFKNSVFRINITKEIEGPLTFSEIKVKELNVKKIKDIEVANLFTTSTDQIIEASMAFQHIFAGDVKAETINGLRIPEDVLFTNVNNTIKGPIKFDKLKVTNNLTLTGKLDDWFFLKTGDHIIGTNVSDFLQVYNGKVTINGDLHLSNINLLPAADLLVSGTKVNPNLTEVYWTKNTHQVIPQEVTFLQKVTTPHLLTKVLNDVRIEQYLLNNGDKSLETEFKFENVTVMGNVNIRKTARHNPDFDKILEKSVQTSGSYFIRGKKTYLNTLKAVNIQTNHLEGIKVDTALNTKAIQNITGTKIIKNLVVENDAVTNVNGTETINDISLKTFLKNIIFIDQPANISHLDFDEVNVKNLQVKEINGHKLSEYISLMEKLKSMKVITNLTVKENVTVDHVKNLTHINDIPFSNLLKNSFQIGDHGIKNDVEFLKKIKVKTFIADNVNDVSLRKITKRALNREFNQTISAPYIFSNIKADSIHTKKINNISVENLIDTHSTSPQKIFVRNGSISLTNARMKYLKATHIKPCSLDDIQTEFLDPPNKKWDKVVIKGNVTLLDEESLLYRLFKKSVKSNTKNVIHSNVDLLSHTWIKNLHLNGLINDVDIPLLLEDAVLKNLDEEQKITGKKWFGQLRVKAAEILGNADTIYVNDENITALFNDIVDKNSDKIVRGKKTFFNGLQTNKLNSKSVSGALVDDIVNLDKPRVIPDAMIDTMEVKKNLNIEKYNNRDFIRFVNQRLLIDGVTTQTATGIYFFENIETQNLTTPNINNIKVEDIVFDIGTQNIASTKHFKQTLDIIGNITVDTINGINVTNEFKNSIPLDSSAEIIGNIDILKPSNFTGVMTTEAINGVTVKSIKDILSSNLTNVESKEIFEIKKQLIQKIKDNLPIVQGIPTDILYLEKSNSLQITVPNAVSASSLSSKGFVLIHVNGIEPGAFCGLPTNCTCPLQLTIEVSPQGSVTPFPIKGFQRVFSYDDENININFITNSISMNSFCRTDKSKTMNEISMLTWSTKAQTNAVSQFHQFGKFFSGYISKVEFFTVSNKNYAVVGRFYDPVTDSFELDCLVIKFTDNNTRAVEIQKIPSRGLQEVYLLNTAQGIVMVLGNKTPLDVNHEKEETIILRFNTKKEQFVILRTIPKFGCSSATGIVQGSDSLIALAHNEAPVQVLKYYPEFDKYFFYQSFDLDEPITAISSFYTGGFGISDAYLCIVTSLENYYIYNYHFLEGFKLKFAGSLEGLRNLVPLEINKQIHLIALSAKSSSLLTVVKNESN